MNQPLQDGGQQGSLFVGLAVSLVGNALLTLLLGIALYSWWWLLLLANINAILLLRLAGWRRFAWGMLLGAVLWLVLALVLIVLGLNVAHGVYNRSEIGG